MKIKAISSILMCLCLTTSCEKFLNIEPKSNISEDAFYETTEHMISALTACYNGMQAPMVDEWALTELRTDNTRIYSKSSGTAVFKEMLELDISQINTTNNFVSNYWAATYTNISRCNKVFEHLDVIDDPDVLKSIHGQALFIRAYHYFNLVRLWGGVFIVTNSITGPQAAKMQRSTVDEVYALIEGDLKKIIDEQMVPASYSDDDSGHATMAAVKALLAKVYATHYTSGSADYAKALTLLDEVITAVGKPTAASSLEPYDKIFKDDNEMNKEIIFSVRFKSGGLGIGNPVGNDFAPVNSSDNVINGGGKGYNYPSDLIMRYYDSQIDEIRSTTNYAKGYTKKSTGEYIENDDLYTRFVQKYLSQVTLVRDGNCDWPIIRVSDVLLMYAEVDNEINGPTQRSIDYVNMVRERAGISKVADSKTSNKYLFRKTIQDERQLELAFENHRWFDLLRQDMALDVLNKAVYGKEEPIYGLMTTIVLRPIVKSNLMLPIPKDVMDINPNIAQNEGY